MSKYDNISKYTNIQDYLAAHGYDWDQSTSCYEKKSYLGYTDAIPWAETRGHSVDSFAAKARAKNWVQHEDKENILRILTANSPYGGLPFGHVIEYVGYQPPYRYEPGQLLFPAHQAAPRAGEQELATDKG